MALLMSSSGLWETSPYRSFTALRVAVLFPVGSMGSGNGGQTTAVPNSLIASRKWLHIHPLAYLRDVFERIKSEDCASNNFRLAWAISGAPDMAQELSGVFESTRRLTVLRALRIGFSRTHAGTTSSRRTTFQRNGQGESMTIGPCSSPMRFRILEKFALDATTSVTLSAIATLLPILPIPQSERSSLMIESSPMKTSEPII